MMSRRVCLAQLAGVVSLDACSASHPDAELLALGRQLWRRWSIDDAYAAAEDWASYEVSTLATGRVATAISTLPATTIAGLAEKASAAAWCHGGAPFVENDGATEDVILLDSLVQDLLRLVGRPRRPDVRRLAPASSRVSLVR